MSVTEHDLEEFGPNPVPAKKIIAGIIWLLGVVCTAQVTALYVGVMLDYGSAALIQWGLTSLESPIWRRWIEVETWNPKTKMYDVTIVKRRVTFVHFAALIIDACFNIAGCWEVIKNIHTWPIATALAEMFHRDDPTYVMQPIDGTIGFFISLLLAIVICAAPEMLYYDED